REAGIRETVSALAVALGVGGLSFYLTRMLLARDDLESKALPDVAADSGRLLGARSEGLK
ncbi:MAG: hypothetical protein VYB16_07780, partial [Gemmatimonadota bacterium]|nr:hypothetical protein [Gemmatimonadota bacterium]